MFRYLAFISSRLLVGDARQIAECWRTNVDVEQSFVVFMCRGAAGFPWEHLEHHFLYICTSFSYNPI